MRLRTLAKARMQRSLEAAHLRPSCIVSIGHRAMCMRLCAMLMSGKSIHSRPHVLCFEALHPWRTLTCSRGVGVPFHRWFVSIIRGEDSKDEPSAAALPAPLLAT